MKESERSGQVELGDAKRVLGHLAIAKGLVVTFERGQTGLFILNGFHALVAKLSLFRNASLPRVVVHRVRCYVSFLSLEGARINTAQYPAA